jgi:tetratricopeptide (TPR) repeat protein
MALKSLNKRTPLLTLMPISMVVVVSLFFPCLMPAQQTDAGYLKHYSQYIEQCLAYSRQGRHEQVIQTAREAIKLAPDEPRAYNYLSLSYAALGNYLDAIDASQTYLNILEARKALPINALARHADFLKRGKGKEDAVKFLERYRRVFPDTIDVYIDSLERSE